MYSNVRLLIIVILGIEQANFTNQYPTEEEAVIERVDVQKPPSDNRSFRGLKLSNEMRVLLISDLSADRAFVSLVVGVGGMNDPPKMAGVANLLGGILVGGSGNFPRFFNFIEFLKANEGYMDIPKVKANEHVFEFFVNATRLPSALRRFADMFIRPSTSFSSTPVMVVDRALRFVQLEFERRANYDVFRIEQVEKELCIPKLAYCNLACGNKETLIGDAAEIDQSLLTALYKRAQNFYSLWYSSNIMTLAVLGSGSLDELEKIVVPLFNEVKNNKSRKLMVPFKLHPWGPDQLGHKIYIQPVGELNELRLNFRVPDIHENYEVGPEWYPINLLGSKEEHSLSALLRTRKLCSNLEAEYTHEAGVAFFRVHCILTEAVNEEDIDVIINSIFQYIRLIRVEGVQEWRFYESKYVNERLFLDQKDGIKVSELALLMQYYPIEKILSLNYIVERYDQKLTEELLDYLRPNNMNVTIISQKFWTNTTTAHQREKYFGTKYRIERIPNDTIQKWNEGELNPELQLPRRNEYTPEDFRLCASDSDEEKRKHPYLLHESSKTEIWYNCEDKFKVAQLYVAFQLHSSTWSHTPHRYVLLQIFYRLLKASLQEYLSPALSNGYDWLFQIVNQSMMIKLYGYSDKLPLLMRRLFSRMMDFRRDLNEVMFNMALKQHSGELKRSVEIDENDRLRIKTQHILTASWSDKSQLNAAGTLKFEDMQKFLSKIFHRVFVRGLIHGNCGTQEAKHMVDAIEGYFQSSKGLLLQEVMPPRVMEVEQGDFFYEETNEFNFTYAYVALYQVNDDPSDLVKEVLSFIIADAIENSCREALMRGSDVVLRPKAGCFLLRTHSSQMFTIIVIGTEKSRSVRKRVESFLDDGNLISLLDNEKFERIKKSVKKARMKSSDLKEVSDNYFSEIDHRYYDFDRIEKQIQLLRSMTYDKVLAHFKETLDRNSPKRRKLAIHTHPQHESSRQIPLTPVGKKETKIENVYEFVASSSLQAVLYYPAQISSSST